METSILEDIGLTQSEIKVYLALLELEDTTAGPITKKSGLHRSRVYEALDRLIKKGLVGYVIKANKKYFKANNPEEILDYLKEKEDKVNSLIPELKRLQRTKRNDEYKANIYEGFRGLKSIFEGILRILKPKEEVLVFGARSGADFAQETWTTYFKNYKKRFHDKKIKFKLIYNEDLRNTDEVLDYKKSKYAKLRFISHYTPAGVNIHGDNVAIFVWKKNIAYLLTGKEIADSFREYFKVLWKASKP